MEVRSRSPLIAIGVAIAILGVGIFFAIGAIGSGDEPDEPAPAQPVSEFPTTATEPTDSGPSGAPMVLMVIGFVALTLVGSTFVARFLIRKVSKSGIIEDGESGQAKVISMAETGMTVNDNPMVEWELEVTRDGQPRYPVTTKQLLPRLMLGQVSPGATVAVKVMADDPSDVAIDWEETGSGHAASTTTVPEGLFAGSTANTEAVDSEAFLLEAVPAMAEIDQMSETGVVAKHPRTGEDYEVFAFVVTVLPEGANPYEAKVMQGLPAEHRGRVGPGGQVPIGVNPDDPTDIALNWRELSRLRRTEGD